MLFAKKQVVSCEQAKTSSALEAGIGQVVDMANPISISHIKSKPINNNMRKYVAVRLALLKQEVAQMPLAWLS